jgi:hypothetical protein
VDAQKTQSWVRRSALWMMVFILIIAFGAPAPQLTTQAAPLPPTGKPTGLDVYSAQPGNPQAVPATLPVFTLIPPPVNPTSIQVLQRSLNGIASNTIISDTTYLGTIRYRTAMTQTGAVLDQFVASGGVFAYNNSQAFQEIPANLNNTPADICNYLLKNGFFPQDIDPAATNCQGTLPYTHENIYLNTLAVGASATLSGDAPNVISNTVETIGEVWHIPLAINISSTRLPYYVPLGGPGGHLSLLLTGFDQRTSLDSDLAGLQGLAMPYYHRQHQVLGNFPTIPAPMAAQQFVAQTRLSMEAAAINPGPPELIYYVDDPAAEQKSMAPAWIFPDATATMENGDVVNLKVSPIPAVSCFYPQVQILSPGNGALYLPGNSLNVGASVSGSAPPFTYTLSLDDGTILKTGKTVSGTVNIQADSLPPVDNKNGQPDLSLSLSVVDANGAPAQDQISLVTPVPWLFLPITLLNGPTAFQSSALLAPQSPQVPEATHKIGVDYIRYYNGTNPDLSGVPPDANGFYSHMKLFGWTGGFKWANNNAWEKDWRDCSLGGGDCIYGADTVDFAYFSGHGGPAKIYFGVSKDSLNFFGGNARYQTLRWGAFSSCQTLRAGPYVGAGDPPLTNWFPAFQGAYMLLGFHSNMKDIAFGAPVADMMNGYYIYPWFLIPKPAIREAWSMTAFLYNAGKPAYLYARGSFDPANKKLPSSGESLPPLTNIYQYRWVWWD